MQPYLFREEDRPRFSLRSAGLLAVLLFLLLLLFVSTTNPFRLNANEIERLEASREARQRDMVFRFMDTPDQVKENPDAEFLSDANRLKQSMKPLTEQPENNDPVSIGNSQELKQEALPTIPSPPQQAQPQVKPSPERTEDAPREKPVPEEPKEPEPDPKPNEIEPQADPTSEDPLAPKPYRKLTTSELKDAQKQAQLEMVARESRPMGAVTERFDNPNGSAAPDMGFSIDTAGHDLGPYLKILKQLVKSNWRIPSIARYEVRGFAVVDFKLHKNGRITDAYIYTKSGYEPLDTASLNAITGIYQAPPLPEHIDEPWIPIKFGFFYNMRPHY